MLSGAAAPRRSHSTSGSAGGGAILLSMSVLYGDDSIRPRLSDSGAKLVVTDADNAPRFADWFADAPLEADTLAGASTEPVAGDTAADDPAQLYYTSGTTGLAKGIVHAHRYILGHEEFAYSHEVADGERFHGMGEWAWAAGIARLLGPWRRGAVADPVRRPRSRVGCIVRLVRARWRRPTVRRVRERARGL